MKYTRYKVQLALLLILVQVHVNAAPTDPIMMQGDSIVTQQEFDAQISKIPESDRVPYLLDGERARKALQQLLRFQRIADDAKIAGFDSDPNTKLRIRLAGVQELAEAYLDHIVQQKLSSANFELMAKEYYLVNKQEFINPGSIDIAHILIGTSSRTEDEAQVLIDELYTKLKTEPASWDKFVKDYSEDSGSVGNGGKYLAVARGKMVKPFEDAAFDLTKKGEISEPVRTQFGFHIIRLDATHESEYLPFQSVKNKLITQQKQSYIKKARNDYISYINTSKPVVIPECALDEMVARYFSDDKYNIALENCIQSKQDHSE